jgi:hypothetical protein
VAQISHNGLLFLQVVGGNRRFLFCFDDGVRTLDGIDASHAALGNVGWMILQIIPLEILLRLTKSTTNTAVSIDYELIVRGCK